MALYCLLFVLLHVFETEATIQFTQPYQGQTIKGTAGSSVNFTWKFLGDVGGIYWGIKKAGSTNTFEGNSALLSLDVSGNPIQVDPIYNGRVSGSRTGNSSAGQVIFTLSAIATNDAKPYLCLLKPNNFAGSNQFDYINLVVEDLPIIQPIQANAGYSEGSRVVISCTATGIPDPDVKWIRNMQVKNFGVKKAVLTLNSVSKADAGKYTCRANNSIGSDEKQLQLIVNYKPERITIITSAAQNTAVQGENVTLTCHVTAANPPVSNYVFFLNGSSYKTIDNTDHFTIHNVQRSHHHGNYNCEAQNNAGKGHSSEVFLKVNVPAKIQSLTENLTVNERDPMVLRCDVSGYPAPTITWRKDGQQLQSTGEKLRINISSRNDTGTFVCVADNGVGQAVQMKTSVTVNYPATIQSASPSVSKSWISQTVMFTCKSNGVPTPTLSWYKPDGSMYNTVEANNNTAVLEMKSDDDFGLYNCTADNGFLPASKTVIVHQIKAPGSPIITSKDADIQATFMTVKWDPPADNGGSPITAYRVVVLQSDVEITNENVTNPATKSVLIKNLTKSTNYTVKVFARNYVFEGNAIEKTFQTRFKGIPSAVDIIDLLADTKKGDVTIKWNTPNDNGKPITQYTVYQRTVNNDRTTQEWIKIKEIKDLSNRVVVVTLKKGKKYEFVVTATNSEGESLIENDKIKAITVGDIPEAVVIKEQVKGSDIFLKWEEPDNNGAAITQYDIYQRIVNDKTWTNIGTIKDTSKREFVVEGEKGKEYEFAVTATNKHGESSKEDSIKRVKVPAGTNPDTGADTQSGGMNTPIIAGAAAAGVLLIVGLIIFGVWWKRRKTPRNDASSAGTALSNGNEFEDGYQDVSSAAAARVLQASGPVVEPNYAQVDVSQKKKNRRPVTDEYAEVDRSKKTKKKPKKQPGELDYAELDNLRPRIQPAPAPSGANARPLVRPPAYEGTLYADIAQFGVPPPEPTYDNMPKKDVVYSNVESM